MIINKHNETNEGKDCFNFFLALQFNLPSLFASEYIWTFHDFWCSSNCRPYYRPSGQISSPPLNSNRVQQSHNFRHTLHTERNYSSAGRVVHRTMSTPKYATVSHP